MFEKIIDKGFSNRPQNTLFHYTNYAGLIGIAKSQSLWLSDIHHLNDALEIEEFKRHILMQIEARSSAKKCIEATILGKTQESRDWSNLAAFRGWLIMRFGHSPFALFVGSLSEKGNLLSQWRGYSQFGKGISIGFNPSSIWKCSEQSSFLLGRCVYSAEDKSALANNVIDEVIGYCRDKKDGNILDYGDFGPTTYFDELEPNLLTLSSLIKNDAFNEEHEWRIIVPAASSIETNKINYREGKHSLVPYVEFNLPKSKSGKLSMDNLYLGPTLDEELAYRALNGFAQKNLECEKITHTRSPYRER
jgi:hypothetical protein